MIRGIGVDIVDIGRIGDLLRRYGGHFLNKVYTASEISLCSAAAKPEIHFAGRWAAKEAFYKALPPECQPAAHWKSIQVLPAGEETRRPVVEVLDPELRQALAAAGVTLVHLSISHERTACVAFVVVE